MADRTIHARSHAKRGNERSRGSTHDFLDRFDNIFLLVVVKSRTKSHHAEDIFSRVWIGNNSELFQLFNAFILC